VSRAVHNAGETGLRQASQGQTCHSADPSSQSIMAAHNGLWITR
jgi:hypothetical protein